MRLPFSEEQFLRVFAEYNVAVWPAQPIFYLAAIMAVYFAARRKKHSDKVIFGFLGAVWLWMGVVYHLTFFSAINKAAIIFGLLSIAQSALFFAASVRGPSFSFRFTPGLSGVMGGVLFAYALVGYPALGYYVFDHRYPATPTFGLPCPTTIYTFGMLLWTDAKVRTCYMLIPLVWAAIATVGAATLGMVEDFGLTAAAAVTGILIISRNRKLRLIRDAREVPV